MSSFKQVESLEQGSHKSKKRNKPESQNIISPPPIELDSAFIQKLSALQLFSNTMFSCIICRKKKRKCNGQRPTCSSCIKHNLTCDYTASYPDSVNQKDLDLINAKIERINAAIDLVEYSLSPTNSSFQQRSPELSITSPPTKIQHFINVTIPELLAYENLSSKFSQQTISSLMNISSNLDTLSKLSSGSFIEVGYRKIDETQLCNIITFMGNCSSLLSSVFRLSLIKNRILSGNIPKVFLAALLAYASKVKEDSAIFRSNFFFTGSYYAKIAIELLFQDVDNISAIRCLATLMVACYQFFLGNLAQTSNFLEMTVKDAIILGLNKLDFTEHNCREDSPEWEELEFKRRIWWAIYAAAVYFGLLTNRPAIIDDEYTCVRLPRNDIYYTDGTTEVSVASFYNQYTLDHPNQPIFDCVWIVVRAFRTLYKISNYINRRHLKRNSDPIQNAKNIDLLDSVLSRVKADYSSSFGDMPWETLGDGFIIESSTKHIEMSRYSLVLNCSFMLRFTRILLYRSELVHYSLDKYSMLRARRAKAICIESALQFTNIINWILMNYSLKYFMQNMSLMAFHVGTILCNAVQLTDHPQHKQIKHGYKIIQKILNHFKKYRIIATKHDNALQFIYSTIQKIKVTNEPYLHQFKELEHAALTPMDLNPWAVPTGSSLSTEPCCYFNRNFPILKHTLLSFWVKSPDLLNSRLMNYGDNFVDGIYSLHKY
ncbi:hypothetical protein BB560_007096 [Smittium megazygosporum]|uniref:Zn(2)-C6 fungal-type domain-containing protein n=1 Tax=Smittium megazygosporum TaxID=133381 RepID=A0A2T9XYW3_9FUNG|nr:hypothetical protein BB560_007096 [Smittium megazygosporum]